MTNLQSWFFKYNAWSFTKHRLWRQCRRAYYYRYIGTALQSSKEFNIAHLKSLKDLDSKSVLQGKLIHEVLEAQMDQFRDTGQVSEEAARSRYVRLVEDYRQGPRKRILEHYNGKPVNERFFDRIRETGLDQLSLFFGVIWPRLTEFEYLRHEKFDRFRASERAEAIVKVDYVSKTGDGKIVISDWKTGVDNPKYESDLQIGAYVLWATECYNREPQDVRSELVYLTTGSIRPHEFSAMQLAEIREMINSDFEVMNRTYDMDYFTPSPDVDGCLSCYFATICPHSAVSEKTGG
jgi:CRISPR/Cas system-associated exonuclease Cas4 (RecB family)